MAGRSRLRALGLGGLGAVFLAMQAHRLVALLLVAVVLVGRFAPRAPPRSAETP